ncbi:MAG: MATE family efflux transporter, partial [Deltaproteobacteria bacterium]|nr:MATE family efflux transporter [Deltaproteobacteria bacterium]
MSGGSRYGGLVRPVLALSFPTMLANILQSGFVLVDMWFVGRLGTDSLAAVSVSGVVMAVVFPFVIGLTVGSNALISRAHGAGDVSELNRTIFNVLVFAAVLSLVLTAIGTPLADEIIGIFHVEPRVHEQALGYLRILLGGISLMICLFLVNAVLRALGDAITPFIILVVSTLVNFGLDPLLIFGAGPVPAMGVDGAAVASVAARAVGLVIAIVVLTRRHMPKLSFSLDDLSGRIVWKIVAIGVPSSLSLMARHVSGLMITFLVVAFGTEAVAAYGVCQRITFLVLMPGFG